MQELMLNASRYTAAFVDYFDSEVEKNGGDWKKVVDDHLYSGTELLINGFSGGRTCDFLPVRLSSCANQGL